MGEVMKEAAFSLAEAKFTTGDFNQVVLQNVTKAQIKVRTKKDNVAGLFKLLLVFFFLEEVKYIYVHQSTRLWDSLHMVDYPLNRLPLQHRTLAWNWLTHTSG